MAENYLTGTLPSHTGSTEILSRILLQNNQLQGSLAASSRSYDILVSLFMRPSTHLFVHHHHQAQCWRDGKITSTQGAPLSCASA